jgi:hypothetical protein
MHGAMTIYLVRNQHGGGHGRCARRARRNHKGEIAARALLRLVPELAQRLELGLGETDANHAVENGNRGGRGSIVANDLLDLARSGDIGRVWHAVADNGRSGGGAEKAISARHEFSKLKLTMTRVQRLGMSS